MKKIINILLFVFVSLILISCKEQQNISDENKQKNDNDDINVNVIISNVSTNSFNFSCNEIEGISIDSIELFEGDKLIRTITDGLVDNLENDTVYSMVIKYSYNNGETIIKDEEKIEIKTIAYPDYHVTIYDNSVKFDFGAFTKVTKIILNGKEYKREDIELVISELKQNTRYEYTLYFDYEEKEFSLIDSFTTLEKGEYVVIYHDPLRNQYLEVSYKNYDEITMPDLLICHNGFLYHTDKYYIFNGFDIDLDQIKDDTTVEVVYIIKQTSEIEGFEDLYKWLKELEIEKIESIQIKYFEEQEFMPTVKKGYDLSKDDKDSINELIQKLKMERFIDKINEDEFGFISKYYYLYFTVNNYEYVIYIPIGSEILADGRIISSSLMNYLTSLVNKE